MIETIINKGEYSILQINFYHHQQRLVAVGGWGDQGVKLLGGRREVFEIADDERLIGCELDFNKKCFCGVAWFKMQTVV